MEGDLIAMFEFEDTEDGIAVSSEKHYRLVPHEEMTVADIKAYRERLE